jgi:hypothetical protein
MRGQSTTSVGRFSLFCANWPVPVLTLCYENLIGSLLYYYYIYIYWAGENRPGSQDFYFFQIHPVFK